MAKRDAEKVGTQVGAVSGAVMGAQIGSSVGLALGPVGAIAGTIPGAIVGSIIGALSGNKVGIEIDRATEGLGEKTNLSPQQRPADLWECKRCHWLSNANIDTTRYFCQKCGEKDDPSSFHTFWRKSRPSLCAFSAITKLINPRLTPLTPPFAVRLSGRAGLNEQSSDCAGWQV